MTDENTVGPGTVLAGRYELTDVIGRGGFGTVWKARQINMDRDVAIKVLPPQFMSINDVVERFKREAKLASRLRHPNTITLHDYGQHENYLYIVMELLNGEDLADVLKSEGRLPPERIVHIARQVLKSLAEAHEQHIVHRDLKPENIFLSVLGDDRDHVKVVDFGIAKLARPEGNTDDTGRRLTMSGSTVGTPTYMSPEQAAGEEVNGLTDLYALGVIMYEAACGRPPFHHRDPVKIMRAHLFEPVPPLRDPKLQGTLLDRVIQKALSKEKGQRFQSAHKMLLALAGEAVAKPVIAGVDLSLSPDDSLDEPSTQEIQVEDLEGDEGPNTDDFEPDDRVTRFPSTLSFTKSIDRSARATIEDAIPFGAVEGSQDNAPEAERESVRSGLSDQGAVASAAPQAAEPGGSSILTVIPKDAKNEEVILLTKKKTPEGNDAVARERNDSGLLAEASSDAVDTAHPTRSTDRHPAETASPPEAGIAPPSASSDALPPSDRSADKYQSWQWGGMPADSAAPAQPGGPSESAEPAVEVLSAAPSTKSKSGSRDLFVILLVLLLLAATLYFFGDASLLERTP